MASEKTLAIVLRVVDFSETSCVVTIFTSDFGKIGALAKGARRPKSPFESALDLLAVCRIVFIRKSSGSLDLLTEAKLERRFRSATKELSRLYAGFYVVELLNELTDMGDPHPDLFEVANQTLQAIDAGDELAPLVLRFELSALRLLGHLPSLHECVGCGKPINATPRIAFGQIAGGVLCTACRIGKKQVTSVSTAVIDVLKAYADVGEQIGSAAEFDPKLRGELRGVVNQFMNNLLGRKPRMQAYLRFLAK